jgi:hypothetical protein
LQVEKATAVFIGSPRIRARKVIRIYNIGPYSGNWLVTGTTHQITAESGYVVTATLARSAPKKDDKKPATNPAAKNAYVAEKVVGAVDADGTVETWGRLYEQDKR